MRSLTSRPAAPLSAFVETLWLFEGSARAGGKERALPDGCAQFIINLREDQHRLYSPRDFSFRHTCNGCLVVGPRSEFSIIDTPARMSLAGIHFKPGGMYPFLNPPVSELQGLDVPLDVFWRGFASELRERLLEAAQPAERFRIMEQMLLARAIRPLVPDRAMAFALNCFERHPCAATIGEMRSQTGLSPRRFIELFRQQTGLTPKVFCRVRRFQRALQLANSGRPVPWTQVALEAGYFDQAHFIHDFRAFSGLNPTEYYQARPWHPNHVPLSTP